jgi:hypothetical protein
MIRPLLLVAAFALLRPWTLAGATDFDAPDLEDRVRAVNEGQLQFLSTPPSESVHHHSNRIRILESSLDDGWVELEQCHEHLDPVPATAIVYHPERIKDVRILDSVGIGRVRVNGATVELEDIEQTARLCLSATSRALLAEPEGLFVLRNGPYMRQFLDGYYPMRVSLEIRYPSGLLRLVDAAPPPQPGFELRHSTGRIDATAWFEGRLVTRFAFCRPERDDCGQALQQETP